MRINGVQSFLFYFLFKAAISAMEKALTNSITHLEIRTDSKYTIQCMSNIEIYLFKELSLNI